MEEEEEALSEVPRMGSLALVLSLVSVLEREIVANTADMTSVVTWAGIVMPISWPADSVFTISSIEIVL